MCPRVRRKRFEDWERATVDIPSPSGSLTVLGIVTWRIWTQAHHEAGS